MRPSSTRGSSRGVGTSPGCFAEERLSHHQMKRFMLKGFDAMKRLLVAGIILFAISSLGLKNNQTGTSPAAVAATLVTDWVSVPAGPFTYGPGDTAKTIAYDFSIMKFEVTSAQYMQYLQEALAAGEITVSGTMVQGQYPGDAQWPAGTRDFYSLGRSSPGSKYGHITYEGGTFQLTPDSRYANHPVGYVTWFGAWAFARHYNLRLPTEQEWEKAARGNAGYDYPWGDTITPGDANYSGSGDPFSEGSTPVGYYNGSLYGRFQTTDRSSPYGAYDMAGNVWEWTDSFYGGGAPSIHVLRGGSWRSGTAGLSGWCRSDYYLGPSNWYDNDYGFRCAMVEPTSVGSSIGDAVREYSLHQNFPNPFNPNSDIRYQISEFRMVRLAVYDLLGREVAVLVNEPKAPGTYQVRFDATGLPSGVYFCRLQVRPSDPAAGGTGSYTETKKMALVR
jgi:formylglycine-generating enzyme required for sulfatase activity